MAGFKKRAIKGSLLVTGGSFVTQSINLIVKIILARILAPSDFGIFAMALILITFLSLFTGFGIESAIVYRKKRIEEALNAAFFITPIIGVILYIISFICSGFIASFFNEPSLSLIIKVIGISFIADSFVTVPHAFFTKNLRFKERTLADILPIFVYGPTAILLAYYGFGVWSLVISHIVQHVVWAFLLWYFCPWRPRFAFDRKIAVEIIHFGKYVFSSTFLSFLINYIDNAVIGKKLGDGPLGHYSFAFNIAVLPITAITYPISSVFHPIYSKLQDNKIRLRETYIQSLRLVVLFNLPISVGILLLADMFTISVLGERWIPIIVLLQIFSIYPLLRSISSLSGTFLDATGHPKRVTLLVLLQFLLIAAIIIPAVVYYGQNGVALGIIALWILSTPMFVLCVSKVTDIECSYYLKILWKPLISVAIMALVVHLIRIRLLNSINMINFMMLAALGFAVYAISISLLDKQLMKEVNIIFRQFLME